MMSQDNRLLPMSSAIERTLDRPLSEIPQAKPYPVSSNEPTSFRDYMFVVLKRKWLILSLMLAITSLVTIQMFRQPSIYEAETIIRIEPKPKSVLQTKELVINSGTDPSFWGTQLKLLENNLLARQVVLTLDLNHNPNFFGGQSQGGIFASLRRVFTKEKKASGQPAVSDANVVSESQMRDQQLTPAQLAQLEPYEDTIIGNETIEPIAGTNLVTIKYRHTDPELAQKIANTLADVFVNNNLERATQGSNKAEDLLANKIAELQTSIKHDQEVQLNFAREHNLSLTIDPAKDVDANKLQTLATQLLAAQNDRKNLQAAYEAALRSPDRYSIPDVQASGRIEKLRDRISALKEKRDALLVTYTSEWPEVKKIESQLKPLEAELDKAPLEVLAAMKSRYEAAVSRENMLRSSYEQQHGTTSQQTRWQLDMTAMTQQLETNKQYLNTLLQRQRELEVTRGDRPNEVSISTPSRLPKEPIGPARMRNIALAFLVSLVAGIGLAFLLDFLDDTVKSPDDVDRYIHLPALALIPSREDLPKIRGMAPAGESTALVMTDDVRSPIAESYRHLRTSLLLSSAGQPPKTILVTSSQPSEGKTTTAVNTAFMLAQTGAEVLIIDCDLRRPRLHAHFDVPNSGGLTNLLSGDANIDSYLQSYERQTNLKILTSGPVPPNPAELLGSDEMRRLLAQLSTRFAHIIVDSPPTISFTDASILSTMVDGVVLVVHGGRSSRAVVRRAKQQLVDVGAHIFGVVLNNVRLDKQHDYYYVGYYSNYYYSNPDDTEEASEGTKA
ncbi:MAG TPA: polysaccharide biosynthesis tyrosine autokinase [Pyrinomonadaceae bacterium]|nr:polysaccharide biosynthesis tyrosine autokinase [Pyrinomonadaceae bacterium]